MLDNPDNKNIYIQKYDQDITLTFMLALWLFIIRSLNLVYLKVTNNIKCQILIRTRMFYHKINPNKILPTTMLESLVINNIYVTDVQMEAMADIKFSFRIYIRSNIFTTKKQTFSDIYVYISVTILKLIYLHWQNKKSQHLMLANPENNNIYIKNYDQ